MKTFLSFLLLLLPFISLAQECVLLGQVTDEKSGVLPGATVLLLLPSDSSVVSSATTTADGRFRTTVKRGAYNLAVTFVGYAPHSHRIITPSAAKNMELGNIILLQAAVTLDGVVVNATREVVVKKDTVEYNAASFGTVSYATTDQLLKKLPGVEIAPDGILRVQGESVTRLFVDGKELYGRDVRKAISSLPADAINKVQLIDGKTDDAKFSGVDDGRREKVINLTLKPDSRTMSYGKITVGGGPAGRYAAQGNYSRLQNNRLLAVTGTGNNVNNLGLLGTGASGQALSGVGQPGLVTTYAAGVNGYEQASEKTNINASYDFRQTERRALTSIARQNFLPDGTSLYLENSRLDNGRNGHSGELGLERSGAITTLRLSSSFDYSLGRLNSYSARQSYAVDGALVNDGQRRVNSASTDLTLDATAFLGLRLGKKGRLLTTTTNMSANRTDINGESMAFTAFVNRPNTTLRQRNLDNSRELAYSTRVAYKEPLGEKQYVEASYAVSNRESESTVEVVSGITNTNYERNPEQSGVFDSRFLTQRAGLTYQLNTQKLTVALGAVAQEALLSGSAQAESAKFRPRFRNLLPNATLKVQFNKVTHLSLAYTTSIRPPTIGQLQPLVSRYDPLNILVGNPSLRPEYDHNGLVTFRSVVATKLLVSSTFNFTHATDPITSSVFIDKQLVRSTQFVNLAQNRSAGTVLNFSMPFSKLYSRLELAPSLRRSENSALLNGVVGINTQQTVGGSAKYGFRCREIVDLNVRASFTTTTTTTTNFSLNATQRQRFFSSSYSADALLRFWRHYSVAGTFDLLAVSNQSTGFQQAAPLCNLYLSRRLLPGQRAELTFTAFNAFDSGATINQMVTPNHIEQVTQNFLGRFYLLSVTYDLRKKAVID